MPYKHKQTASRVGLRLSLLFTIILLPMFLLICFLLIVFSPTPIDAQQNNVLLTGTIKNDSIGEILLEINKRYINNTVEEYSASLNAESSFGIACRIEIPQLVTLKYNKQQYDLYLEPNDTLHVEFDSQTFPSKIGFGARGKNHNLLWQNYQKHFPHDPIVFKYRQYRKGFYYYKIHEDLDKTMQTLSPADFLIQLEKEYIEKQAIYQLFAKDSSRYISPYFTTFIKTEFIYDKWLKRLTYSDVYQGRHRLDSTAFRFLDTVLIQNDLSLGNEKYRDFVTALMYYRCRVSPPNSTEKSIYIQLYNYSKNYLEGRTKYFTMANLLSIALQKEQPETVLPIYEDFIKENPYYELDRLVLDPFQKASQFSAGTPAPNFALYDTEGNKISLAQFKGKVVYLDFWASWCRPCMEKMAALQLFENQFNNQDVVFLHISLDQSKEVWKNTIQEKQLSGKHLFFDPSISQITTDYNILSVPKFFLITKTGNFAYTPTSFDSNDLELALRKLLRG